MYTYDEVFKSTLEYFKGDELATNVMINKYLMQDKDGNYLEKSPEDVFKRCAKEFARIEQNYPNPLSYEEIYDALKDFKYIVPQGSPLAGIGNDTQYTSLANCFVIGQPSDSYSGIMKKDEELAQLMKRRGGVGIDISTLRPRGASVSGAAKTSDGITAFMERYSNTTQEVAQNGRRGALMESIHCLHPNIEDFIKIKTDLGKVNGANISIKWTDNFLKAVKENKKITLQFPVDVPLSEAKFIKEVNAKDIWDLFIKSNYKSAEPGCLFWDTIINQNITDCYEEFKTISTNPCGEIPLNEYGSCILMALNLTGFIDNKFTKDAIFNFAKFEKYIAIAMTLIDDLVDLEIEKIDRILEFIKSKKEDNTVEIALWENIKNKYINGRRVGLGITGLADALAYININYNSKEAITKVDEIFKFFHKKSYSNSITLSSNRKSFKSFDWEKEKNSHYIQLLSPNLQFHIKKNGRRNLSMNTCAPAGSISILTQTTSGIEPLFKKEYNRNRKMTKEELDRGIKPSYIDDKGVNWITTTVYHKGYQIWKEMYPNKDIKESPYYNSEANEIDWKLRIEIQSTIQKYIDNSISSTINLPENITIEELSNIYLTAWESKCKGITIYREGSRKGVLESIKKSEDKKDEIIEHNAPKRPKILPCDIQNATIGKESWVFFVGLLNNRPYDIFGGNKEHVEIPKKYKKGWIRKNSKVNGISTYDLILGTLEESEERMIIKDISKVFNANTGSYTRIISTNLRHGVPIKYICEQLQKDNSSDMFTFEKGIARVLKKYIKDGEKATGTCEKCGSSNMIYNSGCGQCGDCGFSKCN